MASLIEIPESRVITNDPPGIVVYAKVLDVVSEYQANQYVYSNTPEWYQHQRGKCYRQWWTLEPDGFKQHRVTIPYSPRQKKVGTYTWSFDTGGATINVKAAKAHIADYAPVADPDGNNVDPHNGAIGVDQDGNVAGIDLTIPALRLSVTFRHPEGEVTLGHAVALARKTPRTNSDTWLGFAAGELLFIGASGADGSETEAEVTYNFIASENATGLTIADITGIAKKGHEYLWVEFEPAVAIANGQAAAHPKRVYIERVYDATSFSSLFGFS
jgi:hypothetical protein